MAVTRDNLDQVFRYHAPNVEQQASYEAIRTEAKNLAAVILAHVPMCADQQAALRKLREAVMTANAAIALNGSV